MIENVLDINKAREINQSGMRVLENDFHVHRYTNTQIGFFPIIRKTSYREVRYAARSGYSSAEEFLVDSIHKEVFPKEADISVLWGGLEAKNCSSSLLESMYLELEKSVTRMPAIAEVESSIFINTGSEFNWLFLMTSENYYCVFWRNSEVRLLKLCA